MIYDLKVGLGLHAAVVSSGADTTKYFANVVADRCPECVDKTTDVIRAVNAIRDVSGAGKLDYPLGLQSSRAVLLFPNDSPTAVLWVSIVHYCVATLTSFYLMLLFALLQGKGPAKLVSAEEARYSVHGICGSPWLFDAEGKAYVLKKDGTRYYTWTEDPTTKKLYRDVKDGHGGTRREWFDDWGAKWVVDGGGVDCVRVKADGSRIDTTPTGWKSLVYGKKECSVDNNLRGRCFHHPDLPDDRACVVKIQKESSLKGPCWTVKYCRLAERHHYLQLISNDIYDDTFVLLSPDKLPKHHIHLDKAYDRGLNNSAPFK